MPRFIPAWAERPTALSEGGNVAKVHPRVGRGTDSIVGGWQRCHGLSLRVQGNLTISLSETSSLNHHKLNRFSRFVAAITANTPALAS